DASLLTVSMARFDLVVSQGTSDPVVVDTWLGLSMEADTPHAATKLINDPARGSRYIVVADLRAPGPGTNIPVTARPVRLAHGKDGVPVVADFVGDSAKKTGFYAFDAANIQLVTCERTDAEIADAGIAYCQGRGDCFYVGSVPEGSVAAGSATGYGQKRQSKKSYGALYGPWIKIFDPLSSGPTPTRFVAPSGHVMGVYARIESTRGIW